MSNTRIYILSLNLNEQLIVMEHEMQKVKESWSAEQGEC